MSSITFHNGYAGIQSVMAGKKTAVIQDLEYYKPNQIVAIKQTEPTEKRYTTKILGYAKVLGSYPISINRKTKTAEISMVSQSNTQRTASAQTLTKMGIERICHMLCINKDEFWRYLSGFRKGLLQCYLVHFEYICDEKDKSTLENKIKL